ncbi:MAG: TIGR02391 family protein [Acidobacteriota bacterium]
MNLETRLDPRLWEAVRPSLEVRKFTAAILDGIHLLSDVIRERSGLEGDGVALIGAAFGGTAPKLKVNRLITESEQNVQKGVEALLRGVYQAIRNPRSHDAYQDEEREAVAILLFLDYLLRIVDRSRTPFSLAAFVARVLDPDFVPKERYATLLAKEIPPKHRLATCREVFARRAEGDAKKLRFFFDAVLSVMSLDEHGELCELLSAELRQTDDEGTIRFVLGAFPPDLWPRLDEIARLRIENKLICSVRDGRWVERQNRCTGGALGTWATSIIHQFTLKDELWHTLVNKLGSPNTEEQHYVFNYFLRYADACFDAPSPYLILAVKKGLKAGDRRFKTAVEGWGQENIVEARAPDHPWRKPFAEALAKFTAAPEVVEISDEDVPF